MMLQKNIAVTKAEYESEIDLKKYTHVSPSRSCYGVLKWVS